MNTCHESCEINKQKGNGQHLNITEKQASFYANVQGVLEKEEQEGQNCHRVNND